MKALEAFLDRMPFRAARQTLSAMAAGEKQNLEILSSFTSMSHS